jgi:hypothetical protein
MASSVSTVGKIENQESDGTIARWPIRTDRPGTAMGTFSSPSATRPVRLIDAIWRQFAGEILTPSVMRKPTYREDGTCLDPNLPDDYIAHPPRQ